jgi:hypothetical protein
MQKNPCRVDDPLQNPIDRETYEDAVSLEDGIYPITTDDNTIMSSDMVSHGSGTVEQALNERKPILKSTLTGTTNPNGLLALNDLSVIVLTARETTSGNNHRIVLVGGYNAGSQNIFKVCNTSDMSPLANTSVTIDYWYLSR